MLCLENVIGVEKSIITTPAATKHGIRPLQNLIVRKNIKNIIDFDLRLNRQKEW
jgi:hypothetical protein